MPLGILTINTNVYSHYTFNINTIANQHIKYIQESVRAHLIKIKCVLFLISKDFIIYIYTFLISITFSVVNSSIKFNIFQ